MGGLGSGRWSRVNVKASTDDYVQLDVDRWNRAGLLILGREFGGASLTGVTGPALSAKVYLNHVVVTQESMPASDGRRKTVIELERTDCHLGGARTWFRCPEQICGRLISAAELADTKRVFLQNGFIDEDWKLVNWNRYQFVSDSSTERSRRSRQRKQQAATLHSDPEPSDLDGNVTEGNVTVTASDTEQSQKQTQTQRQSARAQAKADARRISQAVNPEATADLSEIAERIAVLHPRSQLKHIVPTQVPAKDSQAIVAAILLEAAKSDMTELEAGEMLLRMVEELAATVPREQWHFLKPVTAYFAEFEYRREPTTFLRSTRAKEGSNNGKRQGTECNADALREFLAEHESGAGNLPVAGPTGGGVREEVNGSDLPALRGDAGGPDTGGLRPSIFPRRAQSPVLPTPSYPPRIQWPRR